MKRRERKAAARELKAATRERKAASRERTAVAAERKAAAAQLKAATREREAATRAREAAAREREAAARYRGAGAIVECDRVGLVAPPVEAVAPRQAPAPARNVAIAAPRTPTGGAAVGASVVATPQAPAATAAAAGSLQEPARPRRGRGRVARLADWSPAFAVLLAAAALGAWMLGGGRMLVMRTPSMGTSAPTGSMVLTRQLGSEQLHRGMLIAFRVPNTGEVYMHRIAQIEPSGLIRTRGDLDSAADGWALTRSAIIGVPVAIVPVLGWVLLAAPWAIGTLVAGFGVARVLPRRMRAPVRSASVGGAVTLPLLILRPFVRVSLVSAGQAHGKFFAHLVNGGLVPLNVALRSAHVVLAPGHAVTITAVAAGKTLAHLTAHPALSSADWTLLALFALVPALGAGLSVAGRPGAASGPLREHARPTTARSQLTPSPGTVSR